MLILVGVTINFAINGGIINKAKTASQDMQKAADKEELQMAVISSMDYLTEKVNRNDLVSSLGSNWQVSSTAPYTCTSPSGNVFSVTEEGVITSTNESVDNNPEDESVQLYSGTVYNDSNEPVAGAFLINKYGYGAMGDITDDGIFIQKGLFMFANLLAQFKVMDNFTVRLENGKTITYDKAVVQTSTASIINPIYGYIENNNLVLVKTDYDNDQSNADENRNVIEYKSITPISTLTKTNYVSLKNNAQYDRYLTYDENTGNGYGIAINKAHTEIYVRCIVNLETFLNNENSSEDDIITAYIMSGYDAWILNSNCITLDTYQANMEDGTSKTYNNLIFTTQDVNANNEVVDNVYNPVGYFNNDNQFVLINADEKDRDETTGYPITYSNWQEFVMTKE